MRPGPRRRARGARGRPSRTRARRPSHVAAASSHRGARWSMRAAMRACRVSGTRSAEPLPDSLSTSIRIVSSTNSGLPSARSSASCGSEPGRSPAAPASWLSSCSTSSALSSSDSGSSSIAVERTRPPPQPGRASRSSGRARQTIRSGARTQSARCSMRSSSGASAQWMSSNSRIKRLHVGDSLHHLARAPRDLLRTALALECLHQAGGEAEHVGDGLLGAALAELLERLLERVVVGDARCGLDHLPERPVRDALAVRKRSPHEDARALDAVEELARQAALPDAGLAVDREEMCAAVPHAAVERVLEQLELRLPSRPAARAGRVDAPGRRACPRRATRAAGR